MNRVTRSVQIPSPSMPKRKLMTVIAVTALAATTLGIGVSAAGANTPTCTSASSDPDGDGWGWENSRSCRVGSQTAQGSAASSPAGGPLPAPENVRVVGNVGQGQIVIGWDAVGQATGYVIYQSGQVLARTQATSANVGVSNNPITIKAHNGDRTRWSTASAAIQIQNELVAATTPKAPNGSPYCREQADGQSGAVWGWENGRSCVFRPFTAAAEGLNEIGPDDNVPVPTGDPDISEPDESTWSADNMLFPGEHHVVVVSPPFPADVTVEDVVDALNGTGLHPLHPFTDYEFVPGEPSVTHAGPGLVTTTALYDDFGNQVGVLNTTIAGEHALHPGTVQRVVVRGDDGRLRVQTIGIGTGAYGAPNAYLSTVAWDWVDAAMHRWTRGLRTFFSVTPVTDSNDSGDRVDQYGVTLNEQTDPDNDGISVFGDDDNDNDGFTGLADPDDTDPSVPGESPSQPPPPSDDDDRDGPGLPGPGCCAVDAIPGDHHP